MFLLLEGALYILDIPKEYKPHSLASQFEGTVGMQSAYTNRRSVGINFTYDGNPRGYFRDGNTVEHITNVAGFRGPEIIGLKPPADTHRILFLGDSLTFGEGVYFEDTYPEQTKVIAQEKDIFKGKAVESINAGIGGYNTGDEYTLLRDVVGFYKMSFDGVVVGYYLNDADDRLFRVIEGELGRFPGELESAVDSVQETPSVFKIFRTSRILWNWHARKVIAEKTLSYYHEAYKDDNPHWLETRKAISDFGTFQKETGIPVTFVIFPILFRLDDYPFIAEQDKVIKELEDNNIGYVSVLSFLAGYKDSELWVHPTDQHPNEIVHRIAAEALVAKLAESQ